MQGLYIVREHSVHITIPAESPLMFDAHRKFCIKNCKLIVYLRGWLGLYSPVDLCLYNKENIHPSTDTSVILAWLRGHSSQWNTFVGNSVSENLTAMKSTQSSHIRSKDNPADCVPRTYVYELFGIRGVYIMEGESSVV